MIITFSSTFFEIGRKRKTERELPRTQNPQSLHPKKKKKELCHNGETNTQYIYSVVQLQTTRTSKLSKKKPKKLRTARFHREIGEYLNCRALEIGLLGNSSEVRIKRKV